LRPTTRRRASIGGPSFALDRQASEAEAELRVEGLMSQVLRMTRRIGCRTGAYDRQGV
jgi:hypothetical protein